MESNPITNSIREKEDIMLLKENSEKVNINFNNNKQLYSNINNNITNKIIRNNILNTNTNNVIVYNNNNKNISIDKDKDKEVKNINNSNNKLYEKSISQTENNEAIENDTDTILIDNNNNNNSFKDDRNTNIYNESTKKHGSILKLRNSIVGIVGLKNINVNQILNKIKNTNLEIEEDIYEKSTYLAKTCLENGRIKDAVEYIEDAINSINNDCLNNVSTSSDLNISDKELKKYTSKSKFNETKALFKLTKENRDLIVSCFKSYTYEKREAYRNINILELKERNVIVYENKKSTGIKHNGNNSVFNYSNKIYNDNNSDEDNSKISNIRTKVLQELKETYEADIISTCERQIIMLDKHVFSLSTLTQEDIVCFTKLKADNYKYLCEISTGEFLLSNKKKCTSLYKECLDMCEEISSLNIYKLGVYLNFSIYCYDILGDVYIALSYGTHILKSAFKELGYSSSDINESKEGYTELNLDVLINYKDNINNIDKNINNSKRNSKSKNFSNNLRKKLANKTNHFDKNSLELLHLIKDNVTEWFIDIEGNSSVIYNKPEKKANIIKKVFIK